jgi:Mg2+-importing ATPase
MDILCTDKTGTLTEGLMRLQGAFGVEGSPAGAVLLSAKLNAHFQTGLASALDDAILAADGDMDFAAWSKLDEIPYDFSRKRLSVVVAGPEGTPLIITKGAFDKVLEVCGSLGASERGLIRARYEAWSEQGLRVLGVASKAVAAAPRYERSDEADMEFLGYLVFLDPPKAGIDKAVADLRRLGVHLKIVTGDSRGVAVHLAQIVGLDATRVVTGADLRAMGNDALWHAAPEISLFVEMDPGQKERVIHALRATGHVVGYLGDGINDAPALHVADVGISVDGAVDVARDAADIVLLEHDLDVLRDGIEHGRKTFANTLKYIFTTTSANFGNMVSMAGASLFLPFLPLLAKQILLNNFLSDAPGMAIATDNVDDDWIASPRRWDIHFIRRFMLVFGLLSAFFDLITFLVLIVWLQASPEVFRTAWFVESLLTELVIALVVRTSRPFYRSRPGRDLAVATGVVGLMALTIPYVPGRALFGFVALSPLTMCAILLITAMYVAAAEMVKRWFRQTPIKPADA